MDIPLEGIEAMNASMKDLNKSGRYVSRFGVWTPEGGVEKTGDDVCFARLFESFGVNVWKPLLNKEGAVLFVCWTGESPVFHGEEMIRVEYQNRRHFEPGPLSDFMLQFMLDPDLSPWASILPNLVSADWKVVREHGFMFHTLSKLDSAMCFNFLQAARIPYEYPQKTRFFQYLVEHHKVEHRLAFAMTASFLAKLDGNRVLLREAGHRKNEGGHYYIKNEDGSRKWFEAEYSEPNAIDHDKLTVQMTYGAGHEPYTSFRECAVRLVKADPLMKMKGSRNMVTDGRWSGQATALWSGVNEVQYGMNQADRQRAREMAGWTVAQAVEYAKNYVKEKNQ